MKNYLARRRARAIAERDFRLKTRFGLAVVDEQRYKEYCIASFIMILVSQVLSGIYTAALIERAERKTNG